MTSKTYLGRGEGEECLGAVLGKKFCCWDQGGEYRLLAVMVASKKDLFP